ncbi:hypothetical protein EGI26_04485 [Lacihabitans sp. CCS-44]|uniref:hypothetical protein n=1 Tax=Lacihabitans sp. CCS-44 TaxID=2487331 RepID=UPI0020CF81AE|nr:hypothetical protein [Lacihabitans sp. CCS-44]MCP9754418.1 hypothetical protein [Lacihabitans sp. CCS-44]
MDPLLKKLNFKEHKKIAILNAPEEFSEQMKVFSDYLEVTKKLSEEKLPFVLAFVKEQAQIDDLAPKIDAILDKDGLFWWAYPKGSSKKHKCDFNRDNGWQIMGKLGYESVRMVAIDEDWSAFRFRKVEFVKTMTRDQSWVMTEEGKNKTQK